MPYLPAAVGSVLGQLPVGSELIIRNNFSTDGTREWLRQLDDPRVRVIMSDTSLTAAENWNATMAQARGRYVKLLCADDYLLANGLSRQLAVIESTGAVMVASKRRVVNENNRTVIKSHGLPRALVGLHDGRKALHISTITGTNVFGEPSAVLFRRDAVIKAGAFDGEFPYLIDLDFYSRVLQHGNFVGMDSVDATFRVSASSWSSAIGNQQLAEFLGWISKAQKNGLLSLCEGEIVRAERAIKRKFVLRRLVNTASNLISKATR